VAAAAAVALVVGLAVVVGDDGQTVDVGPPVGTTPPAPTTATTEPPVDAEVFPGIWPFASQAEVDNYDGDAYSDAAVTALAFARDYLGMPGPFAVDNVATGGRATVSIRAEPASPMVTRVELRRFGGADGPYSVIGTTTDNIVVHTPSAGDRVGLAIGVVGRSTAFEATVQVEVRQDGQTFGERLGSGFVMGGSMGEFGSFAGQVTSTEPSAPAGAVVFFTDSARDGSVQEATVVRIAFSAGMTHFSVFFHRGDELVEVRREVPKTAGVLRAALESLFQGPQPADGDGLSSLFSTDTAELLADVAVRPDGTAVVDLAGMVPNASTSAGSEAFLAELNATVFQFPTPNRVEYRLEGSCDAFWEWLQYGDCRVLDRP